MKKILLTGFVMIAALSLISVFGLAQRHGGGRYYGASRMHEEGPLMGACKADVDKFCKDVRPGGGRIWACLKSHEAELSKPCIDHVAERRERGVGLSQACKADMEKFCKGIPHGKGRVASCLKSHEAELAEPCKAYFKKN